MSASLSALQTRLCQCSHRLSNSRETPLSLFTEALEVREIESQCLRLEPHPLSPIVRDIHSKTDDCKRKIFLWKQMHEVQELLAACNRALKERAIDLNNVALYRKKVKTAQAFLKAKPFSSFAPSKGLKFKALCLGIQIEDLIRNIERRNLEDGLSEITLAGRIKDIRLRAAIAADRRLNSREIVLYDLKAKERILGSIQFDGFSSTFEHGCIAELNYTFRKKSDRIGILVLQVHSFRDQEVQIRKLFNLTQTHFDDPDSRTIKGIGEEGITQAVLISETCQRLFKQKAGLRLCAVYNSAAFYDKHLFVHENSDKTALLRERIETAKKLGKRADTRDCAGTMFLSEQGILFWREKLHLGHCS